jgi:hypothetical protein
VTEQDRYIEWQRQNGWAFLGFVSTLGRILITDADREDDLDSGRLAHAHQNLEEAGPNERWNDAYGGTKTFMGGNSGYLYETGADDDTTAFPILGKVSAEGDRLNEIKIDLLHTFTRDGKMLTRDDVAESERLAELDGIIADNARNWPR